MQTIGWAVKELQNGQKVRRSGWNGKGMWLTYVPGTFDAPLKEGTPYAKALDGESFVTIDGHIDMFTAKGSMQPGWLCSQADLLATDWELA
jgi:hypothetical protein